MKYALCVLILIIGINILIKISKKNKYKKIIKKNKHIQCETTENLNDETSQLDKTKMNYSKSTIRIEKDIIIVHSETIID